MTHIILLTETWFKSEEQAMKHQTTHTTSAIEPTKLVVEFLPIYIMI